MDLKQQYLLKKLQELRAGSKENRIKVVLFTKYDQTKEYCESFLARNGVDVSSAADFASRSSRFSVFVLHASDELPIKLPRNVSHLFLFEAVLMPKDVKVRPLLSVSGANFLYAHAEPFFVNRLVSYAIYWPG